MKIELNLLDNGLDFIIEGLKPASKIWNRNDSENIWKYSALNIFSGIELILKERLMHEHWSLIFDDVNNANENKLLNGDFISINHSNIIKRLKGICNIKINDEPIDKLRKIRNKFEHYEAKTDINTCKQVISNAIRELIIFWDENILEYSNEKQNNKVKIIKSIVTEFDTYVTNMLQKHNKKIKNITENNQGILIHCYYCSNESFMIYKDGSKKFECFVCETKISKENFLRDIRDFEFKGLNSNYSLIDYKDYNKTCPKCNSQSRIRFQPSYFRTEYQSDYFFCIDCLYYETKIEIDSRKFKNELLELEKNHSPEEFRKILEEKIKFLKNK